MIAPVEASHLSKDEGKGLVLVVSLQVSRRFEVFIREDVEVVKTENLKLLQFLRDMNLV